MTSCAEEWLDIKQDKSIVVPQSLADLRALLDNSPELNFACTPMLGIISADNFYLDDEDWNSLSYAEEKNAYIWNEDVYQGNTSYSYNNPYKAILLANIALEGLENIAPSNQQQQDWNNIRGSALYYRSWMFYQLAQLYTKQYNATTAETDLGIALRLESDVNLPSTRSSVQKTYDQIIRDTRESLELLPQTPIVKTRPGQAAANGLLAKVFLQMGRYEEALMYASATLELQNQLIEYNELDTTATYPFTQMNEEVVFQSTTYPFFEVFNSLGITDEVYGSYDEFDLRKKLFFWQNGDKIAFKGTYDGSVQQFNGIAIDEIYLIKAESEVRLGQLNESTNTLNQLLQTRWVEGKYTPVSALEERELLEIILLERRKSLLFRGIRWSDLKRLNQEPEWAVTLERTVQGTNYTLSPESNKYVFPIPDDVIALSGMQQNPR